MTELETVRKYYNYINGNLITLYNSNRWKKGRIIGYKTKAGYREMRVLGKHRLVHRMIFLHQYGYLPEFIDHINQNKSDNRIENLRPATKNDNNRNRAKSIHLPLTSKYKGVSKQINRWKAQATIKGKSKYIGLYKTEKEAHDAYCAYVKPIHKAFYCKG